MGDLALALDGSEDSVSYGLRLLRTAGFVASRKEGRVVSTAAPRSSPSRSASTASGGSSTSPASHWGSDNGFRPPGLSSRRAPGRGGSR